MSLRRRTGIVARSLLLAGTLLAALLPGAAAVAASDADAAGLRAAETYMFGLLNGERIAHDLVPYRLDTRLVAIAQARAADMAANDYLGHTQPDGRDVFDYIRDQGIAWYGAGEIIAWNSWGDPLDSATVANRMWMGSSGHRAIILASGYNYVGMGVARADDGRSYWAVVTLRGPDRTGARASMRTPYKTGGTPVNGRVPVRLRWSGSDVRLQVLTAGLKNYLVQLRLDGGGWKTLWTGTTATSAIRYLTPGHVYDFRVRARDNAGNLGAFTLPVTIRP